MADTTTGTIEQQDFAEALSQRYLNYALSTIMARSLPDVRDGLKPVHRRVLYAMRQLRLDPDQGYKKCARVVGDVVGKFHPHGPEAVYDALVRLAQEFAQRYPLVDGQGNFGNLDGDGAAAMRYTEARMTAVAVALLEGLDENAIDLKPTYDNEGEEPTVLPANFPNLLANGAAGIAVGMATSIPPHNVAELCQALLLLLDKPEASTKELVKLVPGPDFPTGGVLVEPRAAVEEAYATGRGGFRLRARWEVEDQGRGQYLIVVSEIPYQVQKGRLIERIAELLIAKKLPLLADIRDESAEDVRLVLEPKSRNVDAAVLMEQLFRATELETRFPLNLNVLDSNRTPGVMSLRQALQAYLDHRHEVLVRRSTHRRERIAERLEVLRGYMIAYLHLDAVIRIIREEDDPKARMMKRWKLSDVQAEAILNMRLRALRKLEEIKIKTDIKELEAEDEELEKLLKGPAKRKKVLAAEIEALAVLYGPATPLGRRRTLISDAPPEIEVPVEALTVREPVTIVCSDKGWIRAAKGHGIDPEEIKYKEGDRARYLLQAQTTDRLLVFATNGRFYTLLVDKLPGGRGTGESLRVMLGLGNDIEIVELFIHEPGQKLIVAASDGRGFLVAEDDVVAQTRAGKQVIKVKAGEEAAAAARVQGDHVAVLGSNRKLLIFPLSELPKMARGTGIKLQSYTDARLIDVASFSLDQGLSIPSGERSRSFSKAELKDWMSERAKSGRVTPAGFPRAGRLR